MKTRLWLALGAALSAIGVAQGGISSGQYKGSDSWVFLDRFCFSRGGQGRFDSEFLFPSSSRPSLMLYFLDQRGETEFGSWEAVYNSNYNCTERYAIAQQSSGVVFDLTDEKYLVSTEFIDGTRMTRASVASAVSTSRSRYFFFAVGNCVPGCESTFCADGVNVYWSLNFTNGEDSMQYFGADESSLWATAVVFLVVYVLVARQILRVRRLLKHERKYHVTVFFLLCSIFCTWLRLFCDVIVFSVYKRNGAKPAVVFELLALVCAGISELFLILMFMLIMKGWTIVRRKISANGRMRLAIYLAVYVSAYVTCVLFYKVGVDPAAIIYMYDTWPGYVLALLRVALFTWIWRAKSVTLRKYNSKVGFYKKFAIFSSLWTISLPVLVCLNYAIDEYFRAKLLYGLEIFILALTHVTLSVLYDPRYVSSFPFHATTTAMLHGGARVPNAKNLSDTQLRQATEISRRIKYGIGVLQQFSRDLTTFLEEIDPVEKELIEHDEELPGANSATVASVSVEGARPRKRPFTVQPVPRQSSEKGPSKGRVGGK